MNWWSNPGVRMKGDGLTKSYTSSNIQPSPFYFFIFLSLLPLRLSRFKLQPDTLLVRLDKRRETLALQFACTWLEWLELASVAPIHISFSYLTKLPL